MAGRGDDARGVGSHGSMDGTRGACRAHDTHHQSGTSRSRTRRESIPDGRPRRVRSHRAGHRRSRRCVDRAPGTRARCGLTMVTFVAPFAARAVSGRLGADPGRLRLAGRRLPGGSGAPSSLVPTSEFATRPETSAFATRPDRVVLGYVDRAGGGRLPRTSANHVSWPGGDAGSGGESASVRFAEVVPDMSGSVSDGVGEPCPSADPASGSASDTGGARVGGDAVSGMASGPVRRPGEGSDAGARPHARLGSGPKKPRGRGAVAARQVSPGQATLAGPPARVRTTVAHARDPGRAKGGDHA